MGFENSELIKAVKKGSSLKDVKRLVKKETSVDELKIAILNATFVHMRHSLIGNDRFYNDVLRYLSEQVVERQNN